MKAAEILGAGVFRESGAPIYGRQDVGFSPGGPMDRFSAITGNIMLGNDDFAPILEIVYARAVEFKTDCIFVLTGAKRREISLHSGAVEHGVVAAARAGDRLSFGMVEYGFRTYLCLRPLNRFFSPEELIGRIRPAFEKMSSWTDPASAVRLMRGPEYGLVTNPSAFLEQPWMTTHEMSDMGIRLTPAGGEGLSAERFDIVSAPVNDGTVQLTASGPIVLLRDRQTIGGYPRIFNVIGADLDLLAQYGPKRIMHFREVSLEEAGKASLMKHQEIERFRNLFRPLKV